MDSAIAQPTPTAPLTYGWASTFAGVLIAPGQTMRRLAQQAMQGEGDMGGAVVTVCLAFLFDALRTMSAKELGWSFLNVPANLIYGLLMWLALACTLALLGACFNARKEQIRAIFITTGWSFAPWLLMTPLYCYRGLTGHGFMILSMIPFAWLVVAQVYAIKETFELKGWQTFVLLFVVPCTFAALSMMQFAQIVSVALNAFGS